MHTDAVQAAGRVAIDIARSASTCSPSPRTSSTGRRASARSTFAAARVQPILTGGKHERNRRAGTENTPAIAGMGVAARLAASKIDSETVRLSALRDRLEAGIPAAVSGTAVNGPARRAWPTRRTSVSTVSKPRVC